MNRYIKARPILFTCIFFGIAFFLIYAATTKITAVDGVRPDAGIAAAGEESAFLSDGAEKSLQALSILANSEMYVTSRGKLNRNTYNGQSDQTGRTENNGEKSTDAETAEPTAEESASAAATDMADSPAPAVQTSASAQTAVETDVQPESAQSAEPKLKAEVAAAAKPAPAPEAAPKAEETAAVKAEPAPVDQPSQYEKDLDLLARLITAEAQGEPYEAQVAVGAVVMNRVQSSDWPDTIREVIYQNIGGYYQFTPVVNGWIDKPALSESIKAAKEAMDGADPTNGAQFYYDDKVTNTWILAKPVSVQYGHMIFAF